MKNSPGPKETKVVGHVFGCRYQEDTNRKRKWENTFCEETTVIRVTLYNSAWTWLLIGLLCCLDLEGKSKSLFYATDFNAYDTWLLAQHYYRKSVHRYESIFLRSWKMSSDVDVIYKSIFYQRNNFVLLYFTHIWKHLNLWIFRKFLTGKSINKNLFLTTGLLKPTTFYDFILHILLWLIIADTVCAYLIWTINLSELMTEKILENSRSLTISCIFDFCRDGNTYRQSSILF